MAELILQAGDGHVARLAHESDPIRSVVEMIWNAIDAEAWNIAVRIERDGVLGAITAVHVDDDGHGIGVDEVESAFGRIGDSWKARAARTKNDVRGLHGSLGEGRLRAFALGSRVEWRSVARDAAGQVHEVLIEGQRTTRNIFCWRSTHISSNNHGTTFSAYNDEQRTLGALDADASLPTLRAHFAPILLNNPRMQMSYDGSSLDPSQEIILDTTAGIGIGNLQVRIIEWRAGRHRAIYYGPDDQHFTHEEDGSDVESQFPFSAYVTWPDPQDRIDYLGLGGLAPEPASDVWRAVRDTIREHFATRRRRRRREQVERWKSAGVYPYNDEPVSEAEQAERAVFDVVSGALSAHIPRKDRVSARLTLTLLRDAIRHEPEKLTTVLHEVASLKSDDLDALTELLGETTLPAIIKSANVVASRNKVLLALEHLIFGSGDSAAIGERDHLHRLLEGELWIFGEGYHMMNSEKGLTQVLRTHLRLSGLPDKGATAVKRWDGKAGRVDLHLAARAREHDRIRHLIVELKAPGILIGRKQLDQVEDYANVISFNPQFRGASGQWDLILVGTEIDDLVRNRIHTEGDELGKFWGPKPAPGAPRVTAYVRRWRDVLDENKLRLDFLTSALQHDPSTAEGLSWVRERYADILPDNLTPLADAG